MSLDHSTRDNLDLYTIDSRVARQLVKVQFIGNIIATDPSICHRYTRANTFTVVTVAMRNTDHAGHDVLAGLHVECDLPGPRTNPHRRTVLDGARSHILRVHQQGAAIAALHEAVEIVHPRIAVAHVTAPYQP